jgi:hypothetical protein
MEVGADVRAFLVNRGSMSDNRTSSSHGSPLIATEWLHR